MKKKPKKSMSRTYLIILLILATVLIIAFGTWYTNKDFEGNVNTGGNQVITLENFPHVLENSNFVSDLPRSANIGLVLGDVNYVVGRNSVELGTAENPDLIIYMDDEYVNSIGTNSFCSAMQQGLNSGKVIVEIKSSSAKLALKYAGMFKYRKCIGM